jgi:hypothetical protein
MWQSQTASSEAARENEKKLVGASLAAVALAAWKRCAVDMTSATTSLGVKVSSSELNAVTAREGKPSTGSTESTTATILDAKTSIGSTESTAATSVDLKVPGPMSTTLTAEASITESIAPVAPVAKASSAEPATVAVLDEAASRTELTAAVALKTQASSDESTAESAASFAEQALDSREINYEGEQMQNNCTEAETSAIERKVRELAEKGIYQVETILDDRQVMPGTGRGRSRRTVTEYLIKWVGYSMDECTWEPKKNILDTNMVLKYEVDKVYARLVKSPLVYISNTTSNRLLQALDVGRQRIEQLLSLSFAAQQKIVSEQPATVSRRCPFCCESFSLRLLAPHMMMHSSEENYNIIKEAAVLVEEEWYP